ncbi:10345_t:CDS:2, partial [Cetraspora pellucida]
YTVFKENWSYTNKRPIDCLSNTPNANTEATIVSNLVGCFYSKLCRLVKLANIDEEQIQLQFFHRLLSTN